MKVIATRLGYYNLIRQKPGSMFHMDEDDYYKLDEKGKRMKDEDGKDIVCSWVEKVEQGKSPQKAQAESKQAAKPKKDDDVI